MQPKLTPTTNDLQSNGNGAAPFVVSDGRVEFFPEKMVPVPAEPEAKKEPQHLKIAIVGTAPSSRSLAPVNDPSWTIWACSAGNQGMLSRVDAWFEIHSNLLWPEHEHFGRPYIEWLRQQTFPIYMQDNSLIERAIPFPKDKAIAEFGRYFFTSSFAWMMAFAIQQGAKEIGLWGVDMASKDEYILQRSGGHFFIQEAVRRGIIVHIPKESDLAQPPALYGFDDSTNFMRKLMARKKELEDRIGPMKHQREQLTQNIHYLEGALEDIDYMHSIWGGAQSASGFK
jgi:hypothetical protein